MDQLLETIEKDSQYGSFHLDGQIVPLEDYLEIKPYQRAKVEKLVKDGKIIIGPWYILQDEFLISSEANVRNLQIGISESKAYGPYAAIGYFPDSFGNIGQAPQILQQAGIECAVYGRGVRAVGFNNEIVEQKHNPHTSQFSEMIWESPDGSRVLSVLFANWYHNGMEIPQDPQAALDYWNERLPKVEAFASTSELLFMNGCDHQPLQRDLTEAIATANGVRPDVEFIQSSFPQYIEALQQNMSQELSVVKGELRSQWTDGWNTLVNTASSRVYIKQENNKTQTLLEKVVEPLAVMAYIAGQQYPEYELLYSWKTLLRNHPHDSICGCSVDEVHQEMMTRFHKSQHMAEAVADRSIEWLTQQIDTIGFGHERGIPQLNNERPKVVPFVVFNTTVHVRSGVTTVKLHASRAYFDGSHAPHDLHETLTDYDPGALVVVDAEGNQVEAVIVNKGLVFGYDLPDDRFRQPYWAYEVEITLYANELPALGYTSFALVSGEQQQHLEEVRIIKNDGRVLENEFIKLDILEDGAFNALDKTTNQVYYKLGLYEDTGDLGNEYMYKQPDGEMALTSEGGVASLQVVEDNQLKGSIQLTQTLLIPASADEQLDREIQSMTPFRIRKSQRVTTMKEVTIKTTISLEQHDRGVTIVSEIDNTVLDHRVRMLFPTGLQTDNVTVDSIYELVERSIKPEIGWVNPSNAQHQQAFVSLSDGQNGITIANKGLHEYEVLQDDERTIAITLLRGTRELGDWGVFATPEAQCLGLSRTELKVIFHEADVVQSEAYVDAYQFQVPWNSAATDIHPGTLAPVANMIEWTGNTLAVTACKVNPDSGDIILRLFNVSKADTSAVLESNRYVNKFYKSNILEEVTSQTEQSSAQTTFKVRGSEIVTIGMKRK